MKMTTLKSVAIAAGLASSAFGQATSPVVGYETINLNVGFNPIGLRLLEKPVASGTLEVIGSTTVEDTGADFSALLEAGTSYVLEIEDATGVLQIIDAFSGDTLTTPDDLSATVSEGVSYTIRETATIASVFGEANSAGLTGGPSSTSSDTIFVPDGSGGFREFFFFNGSVLVENTSPLSQAVAADIELPHDQGFFIVSPAANSFVIAGDLKVSNTSFPVSIGFNPYASPFPVDGATIASVFGAGNSADLAGGPSATSSDTIFVPDGSGGFDEFFFFNGTVLVQNTNPLSQADAATISLDDGFMISSPSGGSFFTQEAPQVILDLNE